MTRISTSAEAVTYTLAGGGCDFGISRGNACFVGLVMVLLPAEASAALVGGGHASTAVMVGGGGLNRVTLHNSEVLNPNVVTQSILVSLL